MKLGWALRDAQPCARGADVHVFIVLPTSIICKGMRGFADALAKAKELDSQSPLRELLLDGCFSFRQDDSFEVRIFIPVFRGPQTRIFMVPEICARNLKILHAKYPLTHSFCLSYPLPFAGSL